MTPSPRALLEQTAPWLLAPELGVCVVGSGALAEACRRAGIEPPVTADLDLSWSPDVAAGAALLREHGVWRKTTEANLRRGTLALKLSGTRIEITSFRSPADTGVTAGLEERIRADLAGRDMTVGALAFWLAEDRIVDPFGGVEDWRAGRIVPVGDPEQRIREHPVRWLRYLRRAHQWEFALDPAIDTVTLDPAILLEEPAEAIGGELRAALLHCRQPGGFFRDLHRQGLLAVIDPALDAQFDGRPAGPPEHHPEGSQANHLSLALQWIAKRTRDLPDRDRLTAAVAVLCHDLGKSLTPAADLPSHHGHEDGGIEPLRELLRRYPPLSDGAGRRLAEAVCRTHLLIRRLDRVRSGTRARLYRDHFRDNGFRVDLYALAVGADCGGRTGREAEGDAVARSVAARVEWMRSRVDTVDAGRLHEKFGGDRERFELAVHEAQARALRGPVPD